MNPTLPMTCKIKDHWFFSEDSYWRNLQSGDSKECVDFIPYRSSVHEEWEAPSLPKRDEKLTTLLAMIIPTATMKLKVNATNGPHNFCCWRFAPSEVWISLYKELRSSSNARPESHSIEKKINIMNQFGDFSYSACFPHYHMAMTRVFVQRKLTKIEV